MSERIVEQIAWSVPVDDVPVPQMRRGDRGGDATCACGAHQRPNRRSDGLSVPVVMEEIVAVVQEVERLVPQERVQRRTPEHVVDVPVPMVFEQIAEVVRRIQVLHRSVACLCCTRNGLYRGLERSSGHALSVRHHDNTTRRRRIHDCRYSKCNRRISANHRRSNVSCSKKGHRSKYCDDTGNEEASLNNERVRERVEHCLSHEATRHEQWATAVSVACPWKNHATVPDLCHLARELHKEETKRETFDALRQP